MSIFAQRRGSLPIIRFAFTPKNSPVLRFIHICWVVLTLLSYLPPVVNPTIFWWIAPLGLFAPTLWMGTLLFGSYWLWQRDGAAWLAGITLLLGLDMMGSAFAFPDGGTQATSPMVVVSMNGHGFRASEDNGLDEMVAFTAGLTPDLLCIQEFPTRNGGKELARMIARKTGLTHQLHNPEGRLIVFSRYPLSGGEITYFDNKVNGYAIVDVAHPGGSLRLFNLHLQTNGVSQMTDDLSQNLQLQERKTWQKLKTMLGRYGRASKQRVEQSRPIIAAIEASEKPVILCGDFNEVPTSYLYRSFSHHLSDAHLAQATGWGTTYPRLLPGMRIDYVLSSPAFRVADFSRHKNPFSDHKTIRAVVELGR